MQPRKNKTRLLLRFPCTYCKKAYDISLERHFESFVFALDNNKIKKCNVGEGPILFSVLLIESKDEKMTDFYCLIDSVFA
jgi:hypothetical protein